MSCSPISALATCDELCTDVISEEKSRNAWNSSKNKKKDSLGAVLDVAASPLHDFFDVHKPNFDSASTHHAGHDAEEHADVGEAAVLEHADEDIYSDGAGDGAWVCDTGACFAGTVAPTTADAQAASLDAQANFVSNWGEELRAVGQANVASSDAGLSPFISDCGEEVSAEGEAVVSACDSISVADSDDVLAAAETEYGLEELSDSDASDVQCGFAVVYADIAFQDPVDEAELFHEFTDSVAAERHCISASEYPYAEEQADFEELFGCDGAIANAKAPDEDSWLEGHALSSDMARAEPLWKRPPFSGGCNHGDSLDEEKDAEEMRKGEDADPPESIRASATAELHVDELQHNSKTFGRDARFVGNDALYAAVAADATFEDDEVDDEDIEEEEAGARDGGAPGGPRDLEELTASLDKTMADFHLKAFGYPMPTN